MKTTKPLMNRVRSKTDVEVEDGIGMMPITYVPHISCSVIKNTLLLTFSFF